MHKKAQITGRTGSSIFNRTMGILTQLDIDERNDKATTIMETLGRDSKSYARLSEVPAFGAFSEKDHYRYLVANHLVQNRQIGTPTFAKLLRSSEEERAKFGIPNAEAVPHARTLRKWRDLYREANGSPKSMRDGRALRSGRGSSVTDFEIVWILNILAHRQTSLDFRINNRVGSLAKKVYKELCDIAAETNAKGEPCREVPSLGTIQRVIKEIKLIDERYLKPVRLGKLFDDFGLVSRRPNEGCCEAQSDTVFLPFSVRDSEGKLVRPSITNVVNTDENYIMGYHCNNGSPDANSVRYAVFSALAGTKDKLTDARVKIDRIRFDLGRENQADSFKRQLQRLGITHHSNDRKKPGQNGGAEVAGGYVKHQITAELETMVISRACPTNKGIYIQNFEQFENLVANCIMEINCQPTNAGKQARVQCYEAIAAAQIETPPSHEEIARILRTETKMTVGQYGVMIGNKYFTSPVLQPWNGQKVEVTFPADDRKISDVRVEIAGENYELIENKSLAATQDLYVQSAASTALRRAARTASNTFEKCGENYAKNEAPTREVLEVQQVDPTDANPNKSKKPRGKITKPKPVKTIRPTL